MNYFIRMCISFHYAHAVKSASRDFRSAEFCSSLLGNGGFGRHLLRIRSRVQCPSRHGTEACALRGVTTPKFGRLFCLELPKFGILILEPVVTHHHVLQSLA